MAIAPSVVRGVKFHMNNHSEVISILKDLIEACKDGEECFRDAAEHIANSEFRRLFSIFVQQRSQFVQELEAEIHRLGGDASKVGVGGKLHRTWMNLKASVARDEAIIISECQHEEESAVNDYQEALKADLPLDVQYVVKRQYMDIKDAYDRMRILQRAA
jgi:uncharacterized protein (TIGR02284 family)